MPAPRETEYNPTHVWALFRYTRDDGQGELMGVHASAASAHEHATQKSGQDFTWSESGHSWIGLRPPGRQFCEWAMHQHRVYDMEKALADAGKAIVDVEPTST